MTEHGVFLCISKWPIRAFYLQPNLLGQGKDRVHGRRIRVKLRQIKLRQRWWWGLKRKQLCTLCKDPTPPPKEHSQRWRKICCYTYTQVISRRLIKCCCYSGEVFIWMQAGGCLSGKCKHGWFNTVWTNSVWTAIFLMRTGFTSLAITVRPVEWITQICSFKSNPSNLPLRKLPFILTGRPLVLQNSPLHGQKGPYRWLFL